MHNSQCQIIDCYINLFLFDCFYAHTNKYCGIFCLWRKVHNQTCFQVLSYTENLETFDFNSLQENIWYKCIGFASKIQNSKKNIIQMLYDHRAASHKFIWCLVFSFIEPCRVLDFQIASVNLWIYCSVVVHLFRLHV